MNSQIFQELLALHLKSTVLIYRMMPLAASTHPIEFGNPNRQSCGDGIYGMFLGMFGTFYALK